MKCEECTSSEGQILCVDCEQVLCKICDENLHKGGKRKTHFRPLVCHSCPSQAIVNCTVCDLALCLNCQNPHIAHIIKPITQPKKIGVFWDLSSCKPSKPEEIPVLLSEIRDKIGLPQFVKAYGDTWCMWKDTFSQYAITNVQKPGIKAYEALILDLSVSLNLGLTHVLVISSKSQTFIPHLLQLKSNMNSIDFSLSPKISPLQIQDSLTEEIKGLKVLNVDIIVNYLRDEAFKGNVIIEMKSFFEDIEMKMRISREDVEMLLAEAEKRALVLCSCKEFDKEIVRFVSLKVEKCTIECLTWTLRSLCRDEMLSSEKAVQARMREVFDYKPSPEEWQSFLYKARGHSQSNGNAEFSLFSRSTTIPKFTFKQIVDPSNSCNTLAIYPNGEFWEALDNHSKNGDFLDIKATHQWQDFLKFLENYFTHKGIHRPKPHEDPKSIPGGRYGCAQFLKFRGPTSLKNCSLGKLSYMVQLAINDDYLRYQKTLLIWTINSQYKVPRNEMIKKIQGIKQATLAVLENNDEGVSLAQLPLYIKRLINFPLNVQELGYAKLKDLLGTFPEVTIELRNTNHPFAVLTKDSKISPPLLEDVIFCMNNILSDKHIGLDIRDLEAQIVNKLGKFEWSYYKAYSLAEFIKTHGQNQFEIVKNLNKYMVYKIKLPYYSYLYEPFGENSWDFHNDQVSRPVVHHSSLSSDAPPRHLSRALNISIPPSDIVYSKGEEPNHFFDSGTSTDFSYSQSHYKRANDESPSGFAMIEHNHFQSEDMTAWSKGKNSYSWLDCSSIKPPPGFE